jgi:hypothetical protein
MQFLNTPQLSASFTKLLATVMLITISFASCKKDLSLGEPLPKQGHKATKTSDLKVSNTFKWSTINEMQIEINPNKAGLLIIQGEKAEIFHKAYLQPKVKHIARLTLSNLHNNVIVYFNGAKEELKVSAGTAVRCNLK